MMPRSVQRGNNFTILQQTMIIPCLLVLALSGMPANIVHGSSNASDLISPPLPIIGKQRLSVPTPKGWKVHTLQNESWDSSSYSFDLVPVAAPKKSIVTVEVLLHTLARAERHGDMEGKRFKSQSGLKGITHYVRYSTDNLSWYFAIPYHKTDSAIVVRLIFSSGRLEDQKKFAHTLYKGVRFLPSKN